MNNKQGDEYYVDARWYRAEREMARDLDSIWPPGPPGWFEEYNRKARERQSARQAEPVNDTGQHRFVWGEE